MKEIRINIPFGWLTWEKVSAIIGGVLVSAALVVGVVNLSQRFRSEGAYRQEYSGRVIDKWVTFHESQQGTGFSRHLMIKAKDGEVFEVRVGPELYEQAKVDQWVIKNTNGFTISASEP